MCIRDRTEVEHDIDTVLIIEFQNDGAIVKALNTNATFSYSGPGVGAIVFPINNLADKGYLISSALIVEDTSIGKKSEMLVVKMDSLANIEWIRSFPSLQSCTYDGLTANEIVENKYYMAGTTDDFDIGCNTFNPTLLVMG